MKQYISGILIAIGIFIIKSTNVDASHGLQVSMRYSNLLDTPTNLVHYTDTAVNIATWYDMYLENTAMCDTAFVLRNLIYSSTPSLAGYVKFGDTTSWIATRYDLYNENKAMRDTAFLLRNLIAASVPVLTSYLQWGDTSTRIATKYGVDQATQASRDTASALRTFVYSSLLAYPKWSDTSTRLSSIKRLMDTALAIRASILALPKPDYYNSALTTTGTATFYLTSNKLSSGTALYTQVNHVNPLVNSVSGNYTFGWTISPDQKTLTVQSRVATNTGVIALLGISLLSSTVVVPNGTEIQVLVKGQ